jgi:hypothetical protein
MKTYPANIRSKRMLVHGDLDYYAVDPIADTPELAETGRRLILYHDPQKTQQELKVAPKGEMRSGWVVGVEA